MKVSKKGSYEGIKLIDIERNKGHKTDCFVVTFNSDEKYVTDVYTSSFHEPNAFGYSVTFIFENQSVEYKFYGIECDHGLVVPSRHQYSVYFLEELFVQGISLPIEYIQ